MGRWHQVSINTNELTNTNKECTLVVLANLLNTTKDNAKQFYSDVLIKEHIKDSRPDFYRYQYDILIRYLKRFNVLIERPCTDTRITVSRFVSIVGTGRWLYWVRGHVLMSSGKTILDTWNSQNARIIRAYLVDDTALTNLKGMYLYL